MFKVEAVKRITVTEQIMEQIANLITTGKITPGEQLPNERELAGHFGVTRGRVREALRALSLVGLITIKAGEGSFVNKQEAPIPADTIIWMFHNEIHNLQEIYAARKLIESEIYLTAAKNVKPEQFTELESLLQTLHDFPPNGKPESFLDLLDRFDLYVGEICGNRIYAKLMQTIVFLRRETSLKLLSVPGAIENSIVIRTHVLQAMKTKDMSQMKKAIADFFTRSKTFYEHIGD